MGMAASPWGTAKRMNAPPYPSRFLNDDALLAQCRVDLYRGSGPGGQKRNKTSNAVRITHLPTRLSATATESRSLALNRLHALRRLRMRLITEIREPIDIVRFDPPDWLRSIRLNGRLDVSHRHPFYYATAGLMLDLFAINGNPAAAAVSLGVTTTTVIKLLEDDHQLWAAANAIRTKAGMASLTHRG
jgi:hypothetical protein